MTQKSQELLKYVSYDFPIVLMQLCLLPTIEKNETPSDLFWNPRAPTISTNNKFKPLIKGLRLRINRRSQKY